jgi:DNA recombination protein RmuC
MSSLVLFIAIASSLLVGVLVGALLTWLLTRDRVPPAFQERLQEAELSKATSEAFLTSQREILREKEKLIEEARTQLSAEFSEHAAQALRTSNETFLDLATQKFSALRGEAEGDLKQRKTEVDALVKPLAEALTRFEANLQAIEGERQRAYGNLHGLLKGVGEAQDLLRRETANLVSALRRPHVRSRWGELTLRRAAELSGMAEHCDFVEQPTIHTEDGPYRPDMVVYMPGGLSVPVDSKVPLDAYLDAVEANTEEERNSFLTRHAKQVRSHVDQLSSKAYWKGLDAAPEFTVLFLPGEPFFSAAVDRDLSLVEHAIENRVLIATPVTLIALLKAASYGWRQEAVAANAREISEAGREVYERVSIFWGHFSKLRAALDDAVDAFNKTLGSLKSRLLPSVRKFRELGATAAEEIAETEPIDRVLRSAEPPAGPPSGPPSGQREEPGGPEVELGATLMSEGVAESAGEQIAETDPLDQLLRAAHQRDQERRSQVH